jgi:hypothetical protein
MGEPERTADEATLVHRQPARAVVAGAEQAAPRAGVVGLRSGRAEEGEGERQQPVEAGRHGGRRRVLLPVTDRLSASQG